MTATCLDGHGSNARYVSGCRCPACTAAALAAQSRRTRLIAYGRWAPFVDATPARAHIASLRRSGLGLRRIGVLAGVPFSTLIHLTCEGQRRGVTRRIRPETERKILAVRPAPGLIADGAAADSTGGRRRLQALIAAGHTNAVLAERLGLTPSNFGSLMQRPRWTARHLRDVQRLYDDMWDKPADESTPRARTAAAAARARAVRNGWVPPMAWDDDQIDDPAAVPAEGWERRDGKLRDAAALVEDATELIERQGYDRATAAIRLGVGRHALDKAFERIRAKEAASAAPGRLTRQGHTHAA
jgi:hypothetical protein